MINEAGNKMICTYCQKGLKPFKKSIDWDKRHLHKKCWKLQQDLIYIQQIINK